jgi:hypothetical protein
VEGGKRRWEKGSREGNREREIGSGGGTEVEKVGREGWRDRGREGERERYMEVGRGAGRYGRVEGGREGERRRQGGWRETGRQGGVEGTRRDGLKGTFGVLSGAFIMHL